MSSASTTFGSTSCDFPPFLIGVAFAADFEPDFAVLTAAFAFTFFFAMLSSVVSARYRTAPFGCDRSSRALRSRAVSAAVREVGLYARARGSDSLDFAATPSVAHDAAAGHHRSRVAAPKKRTFS